MQQIMYPDKATMEVHPYEVGSQAKILGQQPQQPSVERSSPRATYCEEMFMLTHSFPDFSSFFAYDECCCRINIKKIYVLQSSGMVWAKERR